jgi:hypothetical protein
MIGLWLASHKGWTMWHWSSLYEHCKLLKYFTFMCGNNLHIILNVVFLANVHIPSVSGDALKSIPTGAQYETLKIKVGWRKVNICCFGSGKWFFSCIFVRFAEAGKKRSKAVHLLEKSVINMICAPCFWLANHNDLSRWFAISNSHLFADPVSILWLGFSVFFFIFAKLPVWPPLMYNWWSSG